MKILDQPWKDWVRLNIQRGCSRQELYEILLREGFDRDVAALEAETAAKIETPAPTSTVETEE